MPTQPEHHLKVQVEEIVFRSEDGRFAVVRASAETMNEPVTVVGDLGAAAVGETLRLRGRWTEHPTYGKRFRVHGYVPVMPTNTEGVVKYLGSGLVPGVGPALAERLVRRFGEKTLDVIATESGRLREVSGIGPRRAESIAQTVRARRAEAEVLSFLQGLGLGPGLAARVLRRYGDRAAEVIRDDPYLAAEQVHGIGFRTADRIGTASGIAADDPRRAAGAVLHLLGKAADQGDCFLTRDALRDGSAALEVPEERVSEAIDALAERGLVVLEDEAVYPPPLFEAEKSVASHLARLAVAQMPATPAGAVDVTDVALAPEQREAVLRSLDCRLLVLTGGPGTGKTTTVRAIVRANEALGRRCLLCAPTGRAAKRLNEATSREARTIHRTLEWNPKSGGFKRDSYAPLDAELVLIDEASMLDVMLARSMFEAVAPTTTLVLVGDVDQLPPVGPGQVLRDLIASGIATIVRLTHVFRQAQRSAIVRGAHSILGGEPPVPTRQGEKGEGDLFIVNATDPATITNRLLATLERIRDAYALDPVRDVQVIAPMKRGPLGTDKLNEALQAALNPARDGAAGGRFRPGDKVMQLQNDYERDVFNGDLGEVARVQGGITYVLIDGREVQYGTDDLDSLALAYACTVHKVQGSEFRAVVVLVHSSHYVLLSRALLYTAVTRARTLVVLIGDPRAMARAASSAPTYTTRSRLTARLRAERANMTTTR